MSEFEVPILHQMVESLYEEERFQANFWWNEVPDCSLAQRDVVTASNRSKTDLVVQESKR